MNSRNLNRLLAHSALATLAMAMAAQSANAQDAAEPESQAGIETIVVTAQKIQQNINDVGMSINAITGDQLLRSGITSPDQLVKAVPGFNYTRSGYGQPVYTLRGIGFYDVVPGASPAVSVYVNEVPLPYSAMTRGAALDVQRVEVLKGPQGTLFGQNATGGAVNYIANRPTKELAAGADFSINEFQKFEAGGYVSGPLTDTVGVRIAGRAETGGAWQKSITTGAELGDSRFYTGRVLLDWEASEALTLQFNVNGWVDRSDEQAGQIVAVISGPNRSPALEANRQQVLAKFATYPFPTSSRMADWDNGAGLPNGAIDDLQGVTHKGFRRDNDFIQLAMRGDYKLGGDATLTSITAWEKLHTKSLTDTDGMNFNNYHVSSGATIETFSQELRLTGNTGPVQWVVGANYQRDTVFNWGDIFPGIATFPFPKSRSIADTTTKTVAGFAHVDWEVTDTVHLLGGIRYTDVRIHNSGCALDLGDGIGAAAAISAFARAQTTGAFPGEPLPIVPPGGCYTIDDSPNASIPRHAGLVIKDLNETNVPWKLGVNWKVNPDSLLYAVVSRGYKAGTFSPVGATFASQLDPATQETVLAYEAGFKLSMAARTLQLNGAVFYYDYEDKQVRGRINVPGMGLLNKTINVPKSRIRGGEIQLTWVPSRSWNFNGGVSYTDSEIRGSFVTTDYFGTGGTTRQLGGQVLPLTPKWQAQGDAEYRTPVSSGADVFVGGHVQYKSSAYSGLGENALARTEAYTIFDLRAGLRSSENKWSVMAFLDNATNKYSWNFVNAQGPDTVSRLANPPRTLGVRASIKY